MLKKNLGGKMKNDQSTSKELSQRQLESEEMFATKKKQRDNERQSYYTYSTRLAEYVFNDD